jgi:phosphoribosylamine--glycine ligase
VVVEEFLAGEELSLLALCDGRRALPMAPAQDYKRIFDGDLGPNTGGMGSYSPVPGLSAEQLDEIAATVHQPVVDLMRERGTPFHGVLYAGLMLTPEGPRVLEFNARFGDPETQAILPRLRSDLLEVLMAASESGGLEGVELEWDPAFAVTVVLASAGYPQSSSSGDPISGLDAVDRAVEVTHAGTATPGLEQPDLGRFVTAGGRVLNVTGLGADAAAARDAAYAAAEVIRFPGKQLRRDIALRAVERTAGQKARASSQAAAGSEAPR